MSAPCPIAIPTECDSPCFSFIAPDVCDENTRLKVMVALQNSGFEVDKKFKILHKNSCTYSLSMRSPMEGDLSPQEAAISGLADGIGPASVCKITGTSMNGMVGQGMTLGNGFICEQWYMARILNPFGEGTANIPILANIQFVDLKVCILDIIYAELPYT